VSAIAVRDAAAGDLPAIAALERASFDSPWSETQLAPALAGGGSRVLVAELAEAPAPVGYACWLTVADEAELLRVATDPRWRRRGVSTELVRQGLARLAAAGVRRCHLEVREDNAPAQALYRRLGFAPVGRRRGYYGAADAELWARALP
jgi:ribosomal-protein-alanine N-acetyltransferase